MAVLVAGHFQVISRAAFVDEVADGGGAGGEALAIAEERAASGAKLLNRRELERETAERRGGRE